VKLSKTLLLRVGAAVLVAALVAAGGRKVLEAVWAGVQQGAMIALVALGYTMVYGILKLINFAHSEVFMMSAFFGLLLTMGFGAEASPIFAGVAGTLCAMVLAGMLGVVVEKIAYAPLRSRSRGKSNTNTRITPLVTALGMSVLLQNLAQLMFSATRRSYPQILPIGNVRLFVFVLAVAVMGALQFLVYGTWFGKAMRAVSVNMEAARLMGIRTSRVIGMTFVTGSMLAAIGAVLFCLSQSPGLPDDGHCHRHALVRRGRHRRHRQHPRRDARRRPHRRRRRAHQADGLLRPSGRDHLRRPHCRAARAPHGPPRQGRHREGVISRA
jgi:branched-chain amino acid transport system permease protein